MSERLAVALAAAMFAGCTAATPPERPESYAFGIDCGIDPRCGADAPRRLVFRWPSVDLPVRVWVEPNSQLRQAVGDAIRLWMDAGLYGEVTAGFVSDSMIADVLFLRGEAGNYNSETGGCVGSTTLGVALDTTIVLPFRTTISARLGTDGEAVQRCIGIVVAHEFGHALGLLIESDDPQDLMFVPPTASGLSHRDRASFTTLYHSVPNVRVPADR